MTALTLTFIILLRHDCANFDLLAIILQYKLNDLKYCNQWSILFYAFKTQWYLYENDTYLRGPALVACDTK